MRVCGAPATLWSHGINYWARESDVKTMYTEPDKFKQRAAEYKVDYVYYSNTEMNKYKISAEPFEIEYPEIYHKDDVRIFAVSERAKALSLSPV